MFDLIRLLDAGDSAQAAAVLHAVFDAWQQGIDELDEWIAEANPDVFPEIPARVTLTIAGHTHGGQVAVPGLGRPVVPSQFGERYAIGHIVEQGRHLFVSTGIGTSILPVRFRVPPEISIVTLRSAAPLSQPPRD